MGGWLCVPTARVPALPPAVPRPDALGPSAMQRRYLDFGLCVNEARQKETEKRRPEGCCDGWSRRLAKAKEPKMDFKRPKAICGYVKARPPYGHLETALLPGVMLRRTVSHFGG